jgi:hypothetical protein
VTAPTPALPSFVDGTAPSAGDLNALTTNINNLYGYGQGGFRTLRPMVVLRTTRSRTLPNNADTVMQWDVDDVDTDDMWTGIVSEVVSINTAGVYRVGLQVAADANPGSKTLLAGRILLNGTSGSADAISSSFAPYEALTSSIVSVSVVAPLAAGDELRFSAIQQSGSTVNLGLGSGGSRAFALWVSP